VSIIIPTWNLMDYLRDCLSKIVANTKTGLVYEIIVVDNGSTDATRCDGVRNQIAPRQKELDMYRVGVLTALLRLMGVEV